MRLTVKTKKAALILTSVLCLYLSSDAGATCAGLFLNPVTDVDWQCIFPIKIAGIRLFNSNLPDAPDPAMAPICVCPTPIGIPRPGIPIAFWEPARFVETVKDPFCFPSLGFGMTNIFDADLGGTNTGMGNQESMSTFVQAHWFIFPVWTMMELLIDLVCLEHSGFDLAYLTEVDPLWNDDLLAFIINPEALLFANPVAQLSCVADSAAAAAGLPLAPLFWCMGSWGSAYPLTGHMNDDDYVQANAGAGARMIYKLGREGLLWDVGINLCAATPTPIWVKWNYRMQIAKPIRSISCMPIGRTGLMWAFGKNPALGLTNSADNFLFIVFRKRACCAF
ncbi:MAG: TraU family protein [Pseudomonadota bacterium]